MNPIRWWRGLSRKRKWLNVGSMAVILGWAWFAQPAVWEILLICWGYGTMQYFDGYEAADSHWHRALERIDERLRGIDPEGWLPDPHDERWRHP